MCYPTVAESKVHRETHLRRSCVQGPSGILSLSSSTRVVVQDGIAFIIRHASMTAESIDEQPNTDRAQIPCKEPVLEMDATCCSSVYGQESMNDSVLSDPAWEKTKSNKSSRASRPCKGKRLRYQKLVVRLKSELLASPKTFDMEKVLLPPSMLQNERKRLMLIGRMDQFRQQVCMGEEANVAGSYQQRV